MKVTISDLIEKLKSCEDQTKEVEYVIVANDGEVIAIKIQEQAKPLKKLIEMFTGKNKN